MSRLGEADAVASATTIAQDTNAATTTKTASESTATLSSKVTAESSTKDGGIDQKDRYLWYKCECDPAQYGGQSAYWLNTKTNESRWEEPNEPYWMWNATTQSADPAGLQQPSTKQAAENVIVDNVVYQKYNPRIHGDYDPNAPYAKYHEKINEVDRGAESGAPGMSSEDHYTAMATFNRKTGAFQSLDQTAEQHNDYNKSTRQLNAFFDVDAAANAHNGQSLKAERRQQKYTKKEIQEMRAKRKEKQHKKRLEFYRS